MKLKMVSAGLIGILLFCTRLALGQAPPSTPSWIWADKTLKTPETVYFRQHIHVPKAFSGAHISVTADDNFALYVNESKRPVAQGHDWRVIQDYDITRHVKPGDNLLAFECVNTGGVGGLIYRLTVTVPAGPPLTFVSGRDVKFNRRVPPDWTLLTADDSKWDNATQVAPANGGIWGVLYGPLHADPTHIVRLWNIQAGGKPGENPYTRTRNIGDRMLLSTNTSAPVDMQLLAQCGFTLFQTDSDHLSTQETKPGQWDFAAANDARQAAQKLGVDWCYFPHEAFPPAWYRKTVPFTRIQCLEHQQPVEAFSPWDTTWPAFIDHDYAAIEKEFAPSSPLKPVRPEQGAPASALYVGVHGDYGESGLLMGARVNVPGQREDWQQRFGNLHDHLGWWCADPLARSDFKAAMLQKYGSLDALNAVWKRAFKTPEAITYPEAPRLDARQEWLDFVAWYQNGTTRAMEANLTAARKHFPNSLLMLSAGFADENPRGGNDNSLIPKVAAKFHADVRSTHGAFKPFAENSATMFGRLGSACRFYDTPFWSEPPTTISSNQAVERIFEAASQGAKGFFDWTSNALKFRDTYFRYGQYLRIAKPVVDVAMFYPAEAQRLRPSEGYAGLFSQACAYVRDVANFDIVDDRMVQDGCLSRYRVLVLWEGMMADQAVLDKIKDWVNNGGVLLAYDFGKVSNFRGETPWYNDKSEVFGYIQELAPANITERYVGQVPAQYSIPLADPNTTMAVDYLADGGDGWYAPETSEGVSRRWTKADAGVLLPVKSNTDYVLIVRTYVPKAGAGKKRRVLVNGEPVGELESSGDVTYRFIVPASVMGKARLARLTFQSETFSLEGDPRPLGVQVQYVQLVEKDADENFVAPMPSGVIRRELDFGKLNTSWARKLGKGLTIYFPANKRLLKAYIEVIRRAVYHLSEIEADRTDALPIDDVLDGVYATLFTDQILYYNSRDKAVTKTVTLSPAQLDAWKGQITIPKQNAWSVTIPAHGIASIDFAAQPEEMVYECEEFSQLNGTKPINAPECSPGSGPTCVVLPKGTSVTTRVDIDATGPYSVYARCTRAGALTAPEVLIDDQLLRSPAVTTGGTVFCGTIVLSKGKHSITVRARPDRDMRADFVILTNDPTVRGYDFALHRTPFEPQQPRRRN